MRAEAVDPGSSIEAAAAPAPRFELCVLGPLRMTGPRGPIDLGNRKLCGMMAFLACTPGPQRRESLMSLLWGSHFEVQARQNLRKAISRVRRALAEDVFVNGDELIGLRPGSIACDADAFERLIAQGSRESLRAAIGLYKNAFLSDVSIPEEGWERWVTDQRTQFDGLMVDALVRLGEAEESADPHGALELATRAVAIDELREDAHRLIIRCLARAGRKAEAARRYDQLADLLRRELDVEPDPSTRGLIEQLRLPAVPLAEPAAASAAVSPAAKDRPAAGGPALAGAVVRQGRQKFTWVAVPPTSRVLAVGGAILVIAAALVGLLQIYSPRTRSSLDDGVPIAVMPFGQADDDQESRLSAKLLTDDLVNTLYRVPWVKVVSPQATQRLTARPVDVAAIGHELGVMYVVDGSVRMQGGKMRVNVEYISTESRLQVWSDYFERDRSDGAARDEIVNGIGRALQVATIRAENIRSAQHSSDQPVAYALASAGWVAMMASSSADTLGQAEAAFREALRRDPHNVRALTGLAAHHLVMIGNMHVPLDHAYLAAAEQLLGQVLKLRSDAHQPYYYLGMLHRLRGELEPALDSFAQSTKVNRSFAPGYAFRGNVLMLLGHVDEGLEQIHYSMRLSPKDPGFQIWTLFAAWAELERGHDRAAFEWLFRAVALNPQSAQAYGMLAAAYALRGDSVEAARYAGKFRELTPGFSDEQRLNAFGAAFLTPTMPHRLIDGCRLALAASRSAGR